METKTLGLLTVSQAADYLNIPRPTLYQHLREGRIPGIQIGGRWRIETKVLQRFLGLEGGESNSRINADIANEVGISPDTASLDATEEMEKLQRENRHLRSIIAQQLLELHELEADKGTSTAVFRQESSDSDTPGR